MGRVFDENGVTAVPGQVGRPYQARRYARFPHVLKPASLIGAKRLARVGAGEDPSDGFLHPEMDEPMPESY